MDRSFLTNAKVIEASRKFVCIRLATYEDEAEAEFLKTIYLGNTGQLENTVFVILSPDGDENLCRPGRGPHFAFRSASQMAVEMDRIAAKYESKDHQPGKALLPEMKDVRLGVNVGACDGVPSVICVAKTQEELDKVKTKLAPLALSDDLAGKFVFASTTDKTELDGVKVKCDGDSGILVVLPDDYGLDAKIKSSFPIDTDIETLKAELSKIANNQPKASKSHREHVDNGYRKNIEWKTEIPVTDPMSNRAKERRRR